MSEPNLINFILVEDNEDHAMLFRRTIEAERIANTLLIFEDAESALHHLRSPNAAMPQVILLDINLPGMTGLDLLKILKSDAALKHIPIVMLSTSDADADRLAAYEYDVNSYLSKPLDFAKFRQMIRDMGYYWGVWNQPPV